MNRSGKTWLPNEIWGFTPGKMGSEFGAVIKTCVYCTGCMAVLLIEHKAHCHVFSSDISFLLEGSLSEERNISIKWSRTLWALVPSPMSSACLLSVEKL